MLDIEQSSLAARLEYLREEHRALAAAVDALRTDSVVDQLKIARLKKRKLSLKDQIAFLEDQMSPDIIA
jgi:hypothetical protein